MFPLYQLQQRDVQTSPLEMLTRACDNIGRQFIRDPDTRSSPGRNSHHLTKPGSTLQDNETPKKKQQASQAAVTLGVTLMVGLPSEILTKDSAASSLTTKHPDGVTSRWSLPFKRTPSNRRRPSSGTWFPPSENIRSRLAPPTDRSSVPLAPQYPRLTSSYSSAFKTIPHNKGEGIESRPVSSSSALKTILGHGGECIQRQRDKGQDWMGYPHGSTTSPLRGVKPLRCSLVGWKFPGVIPIGGCSDPAAETLNNSLLKAAYSRDFFSRNGFDAFPPVSKASPADTATAAASGIDAKASPLSWCQTYCPGSDNKGNQRIHTSCNCIICLLTQDPHLQSLATEAAVGCDQCHQLFNKTLGNTSGNSEILPRISELMSRPTQSTPQSRHHWRSLDTPANPYSLSVEPSNLKFFACNWIQTDATLCGKLFHTREELLDHLRSHSLSCVEDKTSPRSLDSHGFLPPKMKFSLPDLFWWNHLQRMSIAAASSKEPLQPKAPASRYHPYKAALSTMICQGSERAPLRSLCPGCLPIDCLHLPLLYPSGCRRLETAITGS